MWSTEEKCKQIHVNSETQNGMIALFLYPTALIPHLSLCRSTTIVVQMPAMWWNGSSQVWFLRPATTASSEISH